MTEKERRMRQLERSLHLLNEETMKINVYAARERRPLNREERQLRTQLERKQREIEEEWNRLNQT